VTQLYLDRIAEFDKKGPNINSVITVNPKALEDADRLDAAFKTSGFVGPLHGIPIIVKDMADVAGMPTTLGSVVLKDYRPEKDSFVVTKLWKAGAIILAKTTLGEWAAGDTYGSMFGATRNPYALDRTAGGSSGGTGAGIAANFATVGIGQEALASIRRPAAWNSIVGMRATAGLVSRSGVYGGWPQTNGTLGPMTRTVKDLATLLDAIVGYDSEDPLTALGVDHIPSSYAKGLDKTALKGARVGVLRESIGQGSEPGSADFQKVTEVFDKAVQELRAAGATVVDPVVIPNLKQLLSARGDAGDPNESFRIYFSRNSNSPFKSMQDVLNSPDFAKVFPPAQNRLKASLAPSNDAQQYRYLVARETLMTNILKVMADNKLDAIVHKSVEHQPTLISDGTKPPYPITRGAIPLNTFLVFVPAISVPAGFSSDNLPVGISFLGRPYSEATLLKLAYSYEQATHHRKPLASTP
jgi:Asp-tRNA(Asn)/Glu-tRNA(Gln) amidotransferase A subunit family amidase